MRSSEAFPVPERMDRLELMITNPAEQPHFAVDPAWPPHADSYPLHHRFRSPEFLAAQAALEADRAEAERIHDQARREFWEMVKQEQKRIRAELRRLNEAHGIKRKRGLR